MLNPSRETRSDKGCLPSNQKQPHISGGIILRWGSFVSASLGALGCLTFVSHPIQKIHARDRIRRGRPRSYTQHISKVSEVEPPVAELLNDRQTLTLSLAWLWNLCLLITHHIVGATSRARPECANNTSCSSVQRRGIFARRCGAFAPCLWITCTQNSCDSCPWCSGQEGQLGYRWWRILRFTNNNLSCSELFHNLVGCWPFSHWWLHVGLQRGCERSSISSTGTFHQLGWCWSSIPPSFRRTFGLWTDEVCSTRPYCNCC